MAKKILRNQALREMDIRETADGKPVYFSMKFVKRSGELVYVHRGVSTGLRINLKENRMRGVLAVDANGDGIGHPTPVRIDLIVEFNGVRVKL